MVGLLAAAREHRQRAEILQRLMGHFVTEPIQIRLPKPVAVLVVAWCVLLLGGEDRGLVKYRKAWPIEFG